jgi:hypothetical protein
MPTRRAVRDDPLSAGSAPNWSATFRSRPSPRCAARWRSAWPRSGDSPTARTRGLRHARPELSRRPARRRHPRRRLQACRRASRTAGFESLDRGLEQLMVGRPGKLQSAFTSAELDPLMHERTELKYYSTGLARAENIEISPQGGFTNRRGLRDIGASTRCGAADPFNASDGDFLRPGVPAGGVSAWDEDGKLAPCGHRSQRRHAGQMTTAQRSTPCCCSTRPRAAPHQDPGPTNWAVDTAPLARPAALRLRRRLHQRRRRRSGAASSSGSPAGTTSSR